MCVCVRAQLGLTLCDPVDCSLIGSSVHGILQAKILEWVAIASSRAPSQPRDWAWVSYVSCTGRWTLYHWATWEATKVTGILKGILCYFVIVLVLYIYIYIHTYIKFKFPFSIWKQYAKCRTFCFTLTFIQLTLKHTGKCGMWKKNVNMHRDG